MTDLSAHHGFSRRGVYNPSFLQTLNRKQVYGQGFNRNPINPVGDYPMHRYEARPRGQAETLSTEPTHHSPKPYVPPYASQQQPVAPYFEGQPAAPTNTDFVASKFDQRRGRQPGAQAMHAQAVHPPQEGRYADPQPVHYSPPQQAYQASQPAQPMRQAAQPEGNSMYGVLPEATLLNLPGNRKKAILYNYKQNMDMAKSNRIYSQMGSNTFQNGDNNGLINETNISYNFGDKFRYSPNNSPKHGKGNLKLRNHEEGQKIVSSYTLQNESTYPTQIMQYGGPQGGPLVHYQSNLPRQPNQQCQQQEAQRFVIRPQHPHTIDVPSPVNEELGAHVQPTVTPQAAHQVPGRYVAFEDQAHSMLRQQEPSPFEAGLDYRQKSQTPSPMIGEDPTPQMEQGEMVIQEEYANDRPNRRPLHLLQAAYSAQKPTQSIDLTKRTDPQLGTQQLLKQSSSVKQLVPAENINYQYELSTFDPININASAANRKYLDQYQARNHPYRDQETAHFCTSQQQTPSKLPQIDRRSPLPMASTPLREERSRSRGYSNPKVALKQSFQQQFPELPRPMENKSIQTLNSVERFYR